MFKKKEVIKTFVDGKEIKELEAPLEPAPEPVPETEPESIIEYDCVICADFGYYRDAVGIWHVCPRKCASKKKGGE